MPPRKRQRVSPTPPSQPKSPTPAESPPAPTDKHLLNDPWTDEEEIGLFKGLMQWKPTGIHKHFRLLALHNFLLANNYIHKANAHTQPHGIWKKLQDLYDLEALDEREDARQLSDLSLNESGEDDEDEEEEDDDIYSEAANKIHKEDFDLPSDDEFAELKWRQRFPSDTKAEDSECELPELNMADEPPIRFTPSFSVEPEAASSSRSAKGRTGGAATKGKAKAPAPTNTRRSARQAESVASEQDGESEEEGNEEESEDEEEDEEGGSEASAPAARSSRSARARPRPAARSRKAGRGRRR
ncbi:hypothetical protein NU195Hw_g4130t1 [Hortaea werneckii]